MLFSFILKGKGLLNTFWLISKVGPIGRAVELETPGFFENHHPAYMADLDDDPE